MIAAMATAPLRNFHLPLPGDTYEALREEAARAGRPATSLAREAIEEWLRARRKLAVSEEIAVYASRMAGTSADLDPALERAGLEHLRGKRKPR